MRRSLAVLAIGLTAVAVPFVGGADIVHALPDRFTDTVVPNPAGNPLASPTGINALPDGRALITEKAGALRVLQADGTIAAADALQLGVCTASEEGLLGAAPDPAFAHERLRLPVLLTERRRMRQPGVPVHDVGQLDQPGERSDPAGQHGDHRRQPRRRRCALRRRRQPLRLGRRRRPAATGRRARTSASSTGRSCGSPPPAVCRRTTRSSARPTPSRARRPG